MKLPSFIYFGLPLLLSRPACVFGARSSVSAGSHCVDTPNPSGPGTVEACAVCFFPQNCLDTNTCLTGSTGDLCERCVHYSSGHAGHNAQGYYRVSNTCAPCLPFPWALVGMGIFVVVALLDIAYHGLTPSMATKLKQVVDFLQYLVLAFSIKVGWSITIVRTILVFTFSYFTSAVATPACLVADSVSLYYLEWGTSVALVVVIIILTCILDYRQKSKLKNNELTLAMQKKSWRKRSNYRRLIYLVLMVYYVPVAVSAIQSFSCTASLFPESLVLYPARELFLYDLTFDCDEVRFAAINSVSTLVMVAYSCFLPLLILFFTLRQKKWSFLLSRIIQYGPIYEAYKDRWCFWEALVMMRKLVYIILTNTYPLWPGFQAIGHLSVTGAFLIATVLFRPFRKYSWKPRLLRKFSPSTVFEVLSCLCILLLETQGLLIAYSIIEPTLDWLFIILVAATLIFWLVCVLAVQYEHKLPEFEDFQVPELEKKALLEGTDSFDLFEATESNARPKREADRQGTGEKELESPDDRLVAITDVQGNSDAPEKRHEKHHGAQASKKQHGAESHDKQHGAESHKKHHGAESQDKRRGSQVKHARFEDMDPYKRREIRRHEERMAESDSQKEESAQTKVLEQDAPGRTSIDDLVALMDAQESDGLDHNQAGRSAQKNIKFKDSLDELLAEPEESKTQEKSDTSSLF